MKTDSTRGRGGKKVFSEEVKLYWTQSCQTKTFSIPLPQSLHFFLLLLLLLALLQEASGVSHISAVLGLPITTHVRGRKLARMRREPPV